ncbi:MAG: hypothetical protein ACFB2X_18440 [Rivularia sp. (in: cyanobacteria)]
MNLLHKGNDCSASIRSLFDLTKADCIFILGMAKQQRKIFEEVHWREFPALYEVAFRCRKWRAFLHKQLFISFPFTSE